MTLRADLEVRVGDFALQAVLDVDTGRIAALMGANGSGKTTLLRAIAGLVPIDAGSIEIDGLVVDDPDADVFTAPQDRRVGYLFQEPRLFPHLSVADNVAFAARVRGASRADAAAVAEPWIRRLDLTGLAGRRPAALSGGQRQRVALARALAADPAVLLLDEPTSALDPATTTSIHGLVREANITTVVVTHDADEAAALTDQVLVLGAPSCPR